MSLNPTITPAQEETDMLNVEMIDDLMSLKLGATFVSPKSGVTLTINRRSFGHAVEADVIAGLVPAIEFYASQDGRGFSTEWHAGDESDSGVWVERWSLNGCTFHGVVDSESRKVVQVG